MIASIGLVELNSIARGIASADAMLKAGSVALVFARPVCPGKYIVLVSGDAGAVKSAMEAGRAAAGANLVGDLRLPRLHPSLIPAINATAEAGGAGALGVVEYFDIASAIVGADAAAKAGSVTLIEVRLGMGIAGKSYFTLCGQVSDVRCAVAAALSEAGRSGTAVGSCVIPAPDPELFRSML
jgi:microcompartment protein CcmL/EutN